ncbi:microtubule-associated tumor suppressor candidate 2 homolog isoform X1 [Poecilia reticulata]|uniref:microtubule-associated tumor suppressor candidate 2 homolog isoform X1 n=1 Tax=Poecilia reticulata TaxID=8081 RepID=UPI0004A2D2C2|nr:PREDICTED: microtubule-associated tumor suppressor candidate 2 isoform X1 [Poecilia reticulata]
MCDQVEPVGDRELRNNNQQGAGDANANRVQTEEDDGRTGRTGSLSGIMTETAEQDKVVIWGTDSQCDDPELAEFEMLECQELEAYLVEDGEDFVGLTERKKHQEETSPCSNAAEKQATGGTNCKGVKSVVDVACEQESSASHVSDTDVFVTCLSTTATPTTDSWHVAPGNHSALSEDLTVASQTCSIVSERDKAPQKADLSLSARKSSTHQQDLDMNLNSTPHPEIIVPQQQVENGVLSEDVSNEQNTDNNQRNMEGKTISKGDCDNTDHKALFCAESKTKMDKSTQASEILELIKPVKSGAKATQPSCEPKAIRKQGSFDNGLKKQNSFDRSFKKQPSFENSLKKQLSFDNSLKKQGSFENSSSLSSQERRKTWGSPGRSATPATPKTTSCSPKRQPPGSPAKVQGARALSSERSAAFQKNVSQIVRLPNKININSGIPKPIVPQQKENESKIPPLPQKPKNVRPKIITYVRKSTPAKSQDTNTQSEGLTKATQPPSSSGAQAQRDSKGVPQSRSTPVLSSSNVLFDKYRQELQKAGYYPPGAATMGVKPPGISTPQRVSGKSESFHEEMSKKYVQEHLYQDGGGVYRSPRTLRPQLGLGAVTRQPAAKTRVPQMGQRSAPLSCHGASVSTPGLQDQAGPEITPKSVLLKSGQSGLRPPGFSSLPAARLAALGVICSSSTSSMSSSQSNDSCHNDQCHNPCSGCDETLPHKAVIVSETSQAQGRIQPSSATSLQHRNLSPQHGSSLVSRPVLQKDTETVLSPRSSPKRCAVVPPKPQSPARGRTAAVPRTGRCQEVDRALIQRLQERCEQQALQLQTLQVQLKKASLCLDVFSITTLHFCDKNESAIVKERELSLELGRIRDEVAVSVAHWEQLQQEKEDQERRFEAELQGLRAEQRSELGALEERLKARHAEDTESLLAHQRAELEELRFRHQEQLEEMTENHEASLTEMETAHNDTLDTLQEEHARTVKNLKMAHEQQKKSLEEEFEKIRLSLQDQVDTLTFQNRSLRDRAKRFEEALRKSTDEQIVDALAPYKHIEEDLKSLKDVLEMKNQQIHQQELKISELEKIQAEKNVHLEERLQVLQQQNEDLREQIDKNLAVSRQLSEENANLQVHVEMESKEKKRLSRTNEELLWRLQTGELSPHMTPSSSPIHHPASGPGSPARPHSYHQ